MNQDSTVTHFDESLKEYLAFRGFTSTLKTFEIERKNDKTKSYQTDKIVEQIFSLLQNFEYSKFFEYWAFLKTRFFTRLDSKFFETVKKLENSLKKFYVIRCIQSNRKDKCREFFEKNSEELSKDKEWRDWFVLPFLNNPELHPALEPFMNKRWEEMLTISIHNFISTVMMSIPKPEILSLYQETSHQSSKKLNELKNENESLKKELKASESNLRRIKEKLESLTSSDEIKEFVCNVISPTNYFKFHTDQITNCLFFENGLLSSSKDNFIVLWDLNGNIINKYDCGSPIITMERNHNSINILICGLKNGKIQIISIENATFILLNEFQIQEVKQLNSLILSPNNSLSVILYINEDDEDGVLGIYNLSKMKMEFEFPISESSEIFNCMTLNHNGTILSIGTSAGNVKMFDMNSKSKIMEWNAHKSEISSICLSYDETSLFSIGKDGNVIQPFKN
eukprot:gene1272-11359_t